MVSRRNFLGIIVMMAVLVFMFQFSQVVKENDSDYDVNAYASEEIDPRQRQWQADAVENGFVLFCGSGKTVLYNVVEQWCVYSKRGLAVCEDIGAYDIQEDCLPKAFLVDSKTVDISGKYDEFNELADLGITIIFCNLPDASVVNREGRMWGIWGLQRIMRREVELEGIWLLDGFLLGGEARYVAEKEEDEKKQDFNLKVPWYITAGGTKTYMVGVADSLLEDVEEKNELSPALIWRNSYRQSKVFVVNGDYLSDMQGIGILESMMYEAQEYDLYPVVNAQNVIVTAFPTFAAENEEEMMRLYSRKTDAVLRDICWPGLSAMAERNNLKLTCFFAPQYDYQDGIEPSGDTVPFYLQLLKETGGEAGLSLSHARGVRLSEKLERDEDFYAALGNRYAYCAAFVNMEELGQMEQFLLDVPLLGDVRTLASDYRERHPIVSFYNDDVTLQSVTNNADVHTYSDNFRLRCIETALGYSNARIDMRHLVWPESEEHQWENMYDKISSNINTYWKPFSVFDQTALSESDSRLRTFLNLEYSTSREGDGVYLQVSGVEESYFLLRVHGEAISAISGAEYREIEKDAYLLHVTDGNVEIRLEKNRSSMKYPYP